MIQKISQTTQLLRTQSYHSDTHYVYKKGWANILGDRAYSILDYVYECVCIVSFASLTLVATSS